jgi:nucleoside-diphosphate-sugar epimerase
MNAVIFGATGMVGKGVLLECLDDARVEHVLLVSRHPIDDVSHPKIREIVHADFTAFENLIPAFADIDALRPLEHSFLVDRRQPLYRRQVDRAGAA